MIKLSNKEKIELYWIFLSMIDVKGLEVACNRRDLDFLTTALFAEFSRIDLKAHYSIRVHASVFKLALWLFNDYLVDAIAKFIQSDLNWDYQAIENGVTKYIDWE